MNKKTLFIMLIGTSLFLFNALSLFKTGDVVMRHDAPGPVTSIPDASGQMSLVPTGATQQLSPTSRPTTGPHHPLPSEFRAHVRVAYATWVADTLSKGPTQAERVAQQLAREGSSESSLKLIALALASAGELRSNLCLTIESVDNPESTYVLALQASDKGSDISLSCFSAVKRMPGDQVVPALEEIIEGYGQPVDPTAPKNNIVVGEEQLLAPGMSAGELDELISQRATVRDIPALLHGMENRSDVHARMSAYSLACIRDPNALKQLFLALDGSQLSDHYGLGIEIGSSVDGIGAECVPVLIKGLQAKPSGTALAIATKMLMEMRGPEASDALLAAYSGGRQSAKLLGDIHIILRYRTVFAIDKMERYPNARLFFSNSSNISRLWDGKL